VGEDLFLGAVLEQPAWQGEIGLHNPTRKAFERVQAALKAGYVQQQVNKHDLDEPEKRLVTALLNLQVNERADLEKLTRF